MSGVSYTARRHDHLGNTASLLDGDATHDAPSVRSCVVDRVLSGFSCVSVVRGGGRA